MEWDSNWGPHDYLTSFQTIFQQRGTQDLSIYAIHSGWQANCKVMPNLALHPLGRHPLTPRECTIHLWTHNGWTAGQGFFVISSSLMKHSLCRCVEIITTDFNIYLLFITMIKLGKERDVIVFIWRRSFPLATKFPVWQPPARSKGNHRTPYRALPCRRLRRLGGPVKKNPQTAVMVKHSAYDWHVSSKLYV